MIAFVYIKQERFYFNPKTLPKEYTYQFDSSFEEFNIEVEKDIHLNALLFKTDSIRKGVILYFHGNAGAIHEWGKRAPLYTENSYDVLFVDYRGYGKSDGFYSKESQIYNDAQKIYDFLKTTYNENEIVVLGFSLGSGFASYTAGHNNPKLLILEAPYFAWDELIHQISSLPKFMVNYKIPSYKFLETVHCPIKILHGTRDYLIKPEINSKRLKALFPNKVEFYPIHEAGHNGIFITKQYYDLLKVFL